MMLVISGADLVGKTTFATKCTKILQEKYGLSHMLHHLSRPPASFDYYHDYVDRMCVTSVWDRFHLDELAYRQCDDRASKMTPLRFALVEAQFRLRCGFQVVLIADSSDIEKRHAQNGDVMYSLEHILKVNEKFREMHDAFNHGIVYMRDRKYRLSIDMYGDVLDENSMRPELVCEMYFNRLQWYREIIER